MACRPECRSSRLWRVAVALATKTPARTEDVIPWRPEPRPGASRRVFSAAASLVGVRFKFAVREAPGIDRCLWPRWTFRSTAVREVNDCPFLIHGGEEGVIAADAAGDGDRSHAVKGMTLRYLDRKLGLELGAIRRRYVFPSRRERARRPIVVVVVRHLVSLSRKP